MVYPLLNPCPDCLSWEKNRPGDGRGSRSPPDRSDSTFVRSTAHEHASRGSGSSDHKHKQTRMMRRDTLVTWLTWLISEATVMPTLQNVRVRSAPSAPT